MMADEKKERALACQEDKAEREAGRNRILIPMDQLGSEVAKSTATSSTQIQALQEENAQLRLSMEALMNRMNHMEADHTQADSPTRKNLARPTAPATPTHPAHPAHQPWQLSHNQFSHPLSGNAMDTALPLLPRSPPPTLSHEQIGGCS